MLDSFSQARDGKGLIRIIGIGSPFGDDAIGLIVARTLAEAPPPNCEVIAADRPGTALIDLFDGADTVILIDAVKSGRPPGYIHEFDFEDLDRVDGSFASAHDLGVVATLQLARKLGRAPVRGRVVGVEIAPTQTNQLDNLSPIARAAIKGVIDRVRLSTQIDQRERRRLIVSGVVQGVGMRPLVSRLATSLKLAGFVRNVPSGVEIEIEGDPSFLQEFHQRLIDEAPTASAIAEIKSLNLHPIGESDFRAMPSTSGCTATMIPPDLAICADCLGEVRDKTDRRYRYPFTNCTACGPRFTVVRSLPYDRESTTLSEFPLCEQCQREYLDPLDRRFRAEPTACPTCGPQAWLEINESRVRSREHLDAIAQAAAILRDGGIVAVQGIGGVHLACDASNEATVKRLRAIRRRPHKPLAVMVESIDDARCLAVILDDEAAMLARRSAPIVLLPKRDDARIAPSVAPGNDQIGIMLAYSPLHQLLLRDCGLPLVMTSANVPGEPLARDGDDIRSTFPGELDALLLHNRPIHQRCDDSVWKVGSRGAEPIRLGRGDTPSAITVPAEAARPILASGGDIKNSFCLLSGRTALMSQYIGTLENIATQDHFRESLQHWLAMSDIKPMVAAHDLHPQSFASNLVSELGLEMVAVQHHHGHIAACMAENGQKSPVIGIAFDGAGYGVDGAIWGGEVMIAEYRDFHRLSHLQYLPLPGGDAVARRPDRIAAGFLIALFGIRFDDQVSRLVGRQDALVLAKMIEQEINTFRTSSCGRLFDAVAALLGVCSATTYEGQAAIELEVLARRSAPSRRVYPCSIIEGVAQTEEIFEGILTDLKEGRSIGEIARAFHDTMAEVILKMAVDAREQTGIEVVALSGGCFQNRLLLAASIERLEESGFTVLSHRRVPANDGGLALGQAVIAAARLNPKGSGGASCA